MQGSRILTTAALAVLIAGGGVGAVRAGDKPEIRPAVFDPDQAVADASKAEQAGQFEKALQLYLKAFTSGRTDLDLRDHIRFCFRHVAQAQRHRDPAFRQFVLSLQPSDALALYAEVLDKVQKTYADRTRATVEHMFAAGLDELTTALADPHFRSEHLKGVSEAKVDEFTTTVRDSWASTPPATVHEGVRAARSIARQAHTLLGLKNGAVVVFELLCGACVGLDEYSAYVPPQGERPDPQPLGDFTAYGLIVHQETRGLVVDAVLPNSWAAVHTPLRRGDEITKVNAKSVAGGTVALADALRAADALGHYLEIASGDELGRAVRLPSPVPTVYAADMLDPKEGVGYLRLASFTDRTPDEFDDAVLELRARGMKALVIDLRGNPGGIFTAAVGVAERLIPSGPVSTTDGQVPDFANRVFTSETGMAAYDFPVVLLIDTKTMSAAEILAASLKDNRRATLVGLGTFGKGLIQASIRLSALDGTTDPSSKSGLLVLSVGVAHGPFSGAIHGRGVIPHLIEADPHRQLAVALEKAVELLAGVPTPAMPPIIMR